MKKFLFLLAFVFSPITFASEPPLQGGAEGKIRSIVVKETGNIIIGFHENHANPGGCDRSNAVLIYDYHKPKKEMLTVSLVAYALQSPVNFWVIGCEGDVPIARTISAN